ncbi:MAG: response regulator [candidate division NC10 bacterium]
MENCSILVIDDDHEFSDRLRSILTDGGFEVLAAPDSPTGIATARTVQPAAIVLDMTMPDLDGIDACKRLKGDPVLGDIPVVGITASPDLTDVAKAFYAGADFFVPKPFEVESLLHVVGLATDATLRGTVMRFPRHPRFPVELPVRCLVRGDAETTREVLGQTGNVSLGGLMLVLSEALEPGSIFRLQLGLPEWAITAEGTAIWQAAKPTGEGKNTHGIRFLRFTEDADLVQYRRLLSQTAAGHSAGTSRTEAPQR